MIERVEMNDAQFMRAAYVLGVNLGHKSLEEIMLWLHKISQVAALNGCSDANRIRIEHDYPKV